MIDGQLYTGWSDATFKVQSYNGTTSARRRRSRSSWNGVSATLNRFATQDLADITGMFYDPATGRMYFTKSGSNQLHWRGFSSESRVVGAQRFSSASDAGGVSWDNVQGMFMVDNQLYTSSSNGDLVRRTWNPSTGLPVSGTNVAVSGPNIDGEDWGGPRHLQLRPGRLRGPEHAADGLVLGVLQRRHLLVRCRSELSPDGSHRVLRLGLR